MGNRLYIHDSLTNNRPLRILIIQDAYTKKVVGYRINRSITAERYSKNKVKRKILSTKSSNYFSQFILTRTLFPQRYITVRNTASP